MYNIIHHNLDVAKEPYCTLRFINLLKGEIVHYSVKIDTNKIADIIGIFRTIGNLVIGTNTPDLTDVKKISIK
jgi:hypothetical protein